MPRNRNIETIGRQDRNEAKEYTRSDLEAQLTRFRRMLIDLVEGKPNLAFVKKVVEGHLQHVEGNPLLEVRGSYAGIIEAIKAFEHILDPLKSNQQTTDDGRFKSQQKKNVGVTITDVRKFTDMTRKLKERKDGLTVGKLLKNTYFPYLMRVYDKHQLHYTNYTGDGILAYGEDRIDALGRKTLPALDNTILADVEAVAVTESIAESWKRTKNLRLMMEDGSVHETGFGAAYGDIELLDPLVPDPDETIFAEFDRNFKEIALKRAPDFEPRLTFESIMRSSHATGEPLNEAARMQDIDKKYPEHTVILSEDVLDQVHCKESIKALFQRGVGVETPRGLGRSIKIAAIQRGRQICVADLMEQAFNEAARQPYTKSANKNQNHGVPHEPTSNGRAAGPVPQPQGRRRRARSTR